MSSKSMLFTVMTNVRVAGQLTFIPAHKDASGKDISAQCIIPVYSNKLGRKDKTTGARGEGRKDTFKLVAWGPLAVTCALSCAPGKDLTIFGEPGSYVGKLYNKDNSLRLDQHGQVIEITKNSTTILSITFGEDSAKQIEKEIAMGRRHVNWNNPNHPDYEAFKQVLRDRQKTQFVPGSKEFGFARVVNPTGTVAPAQPAANPMAALAGMDQASMMAALLAMQQGLTAPAAPAAPIAGTVSAAPNGKAVTPF